MNPSVSITVEKMDDGHNAKCPRCWRWHGCNENFGWRPEDIETKAVEAQKKMEQDKSINPMEIPERVKKFRDGVENEHLCDRCIDALFTSFPDHPSIPYIKESLQKQKEKYSI